MLSRVGADISLTRRAQELEFLADASVINPQQLSSLLSQLPTAEDAARSVAEQQSRSVPPTAISPQPVAPQAVPPPAFQAQSPPPTAQMNNVSLNEKAPPPQAAIPSPGPPPGPPAPPPGAPPVLAVANAIYAYTPTDHGDLAIQPGDRILVREYMNGDWWGGLNERSNQQGIFPRSYVRVVDEKSAYANATPPPSYGNMPMEVSQGGQPSNDNPGDPNNKYKEGGKKLGKKFGNAAVFGAGATAGSNRKFIGACEGNRSS